MTAPVDESLAQMCAGLLGVERFDVDEDFFEAGGHSLTAIRLTARIRSRYGIAVPVADVFNYPTMRELAKVVLTMLDSATVEADGAGQHA